MKTLVCPQEGAVWRAARATRWDEALTTHVKECSVCREIVQTTRWMQALPQPAERTPALPDASLLWRRSRLLQKQAEAQRTLRTLDLVEVLPGAIFALAFAGWLAWNWSSAGGLLTWVLVRMLPQVWRFTWTVATAAPFFSSGTFLLAAVALSLGAIFAASPLLAKE